MSPGHRLTPMTLDRALPDSHDPGLVDFSLLGSPMSGVSHLSIALLPVLLDGV